VTTAVRIGSLVRLRSGGPDMTINSIWQTFWGRHICTCVWIDSSGKRQCDKFDSKALTKIVRNPS